MNPDEAQRYRESIREAATDLKESAKNLIRCIEDAAERKAHEAFGVSFVEFVAGALEGQAIGKLLAANDRDEFIAVLKRCGASTRWVAELLEVSQATAARAGRARGESNDSEPPLERFQRERNLIDSRIQSLTKAIEARPNLPAHSVPKAHETARRLRELAGALDALADQQRAAA